jgi:hypothetical protein
MKLAIAALLSIGVFGLGLVGCGGAGQYGHAPLYAPLGDEEAAASGVPDYDPVMVKRSPEKWKGKTVSVFGIVISRSAGSGGNASVKLSVRTLEPRNLCESPDNDSCRVTVSEHEHAVVHGLLRLSSEDDLGEHSMGPRSLVRIIGTVTDEVDQADGEPVLKAKYYRHWPRDSYATTADRSYMRR